jgi:hypothetical protein
MREEKSVSVEITSEVKTVAQTKTITKSVIARYSVSAAPPAVGAPKFIYPPGTLRNYSLLQLLTWYEANLRAKQHVDPRGHEVVFDLSRFMYLVKLVDLNGEKIQHPLWYTEELKAGRLTEQDFGAFDQHRAETLSWLSWMIANPLRIRKNVCVHVPGEEVYIREVNPNHRERFKLLYCDRVGPQLLVPVTSFRQKKEPKGEILWP